MTAGVKSSHESRYAYIDLQCVCVCVCIHTYIHISVQAYIQTHTHARTNRRCGKCPCTNFFWWLEGPTDWVYWVWKTTDTLKNLYFFTNLEQMLQHTATDPSTKPTTMKQRMNGAFKNFRFEPDGCYCLRLIGNYVLFRVNWINKSSSSCSPTGRCPILWSPVNWEAKQQARPV